jgi:hypothetical protein
LPSKIFIHHLWTRFQVIPYKPLLSLTSLFPDDSFHFDSIGPINLDVPSDHPQPSTSRAPEPILYETSESSSSEKEEESSDEEERVSELGEQTKSVAYVISVNQTYLELIDRLMAKVESLLENNREEQVGV